MPARDFYFDYYTGKLWDRIPLIYREEDGLASPPGVLRAIVEMVAGQFARRIGTLPIPPIYREEDGLASPPGVLRAIVEMVAGQFARRIGTPLIPPIYREEDGLASTPGVLRAVIEMATARRTGAPLWGGGRAS
jgi:hypothetical protein